MKKVKPSHLPALEVNINKGKVHVDGENVNYSFGSLHHVFRKAIRFKHKELSKAQSALILGFGAGSIAKILWNEKNYPIQITGVDFEPEMLDLAKEHSGIVNFDQLNLIEADANEFIASCNVTFDVIFIDLFVEDQIPGFCFADAFLSNTKKCLNDRGVVIWNTLAHTDLEKTIAQLARKSRFNSLQCISVTKENLICILVG